MALLTSPPQQRSFPLLAPPLGPDCVGSVDGPCGHGPQPCGTGQDILHGRRHVSTGHPVRRMQGQRQRRGGTGRHATPHIDQGPGAPHWRWGRGQGGGLLINLHQHLGWQICPAPARQWQWQWYGGGSAVALALAMAVAVLGPTAAECHVLFAAHAPCSSCSGAAPAARSAWHFIERRGSQRGYAQESPRARGGPAKASSDCSAGATSHKHVPITSHQSMAKRHVKEYSNCADHLVGPSQDGSIKPSRWWAREDVEM